MKAPCIRTRLRFALTLGSFTVRELARMLSVSAHAVYQILPKLRREKVVKISGFRKENPYHRPSLMWTINHG